MLRHFISRFSPRKLCLVADNSAVIRRAAASILRDLRFHVAEAENGQDALIKCHQRTPDAVLLDGSMDYLDGFEFLQALKDRALAGQTKIIFCTADRDPSRIARAIEAGAHEYVIKPFDRSILTAKFEKLGLTA
ncbi:MULTISPECIES: response regulator [Rhodomicrobium]|uniref:response regulator n=1 Tax=Rhodomicrobium TaxID=1068 RepID=UPI001FDA9B5E|nr:MULTISPECIES: response regulator [Rhodomicrobium]